ncbi:MAG: hypothetical protein U0931_30825 [Vulcanimicrobiota bacterium]
MYSSRGLGADSSVEVEPRGCEAVAFFLAIHLTLYQELRQRHC